MQNLLLLFIRFGGFLVFILLEGFCFYMVVKYNKTQQSIYANSSNVISGNVYSKYDKVLRYFHLEEISDSVMAENAKLYQQLTFLKSLDTIPTIDTLVGDSILSRYEFVPARVINNVANLNENSMTLDKGSLNGIRKGMGVISNNGIVGIVRNVTPHFCQVMTVLSSNSIISTSIKRNNFFGSLTWNRKDSRYLKMDAVPKHADILKGDTIQTSGYSTVFPKGIFVGTVDSFWIETGTGFYELRVKTLQELLNIKYVYVVRNFDEEELKTLDDMSHINTNIKK